MSRKPKFDVSLADRQRQSREAKAKIQGKKLYRIYEPIGHDDNTGPVRLSYDDWFVTHYLNKYRYTYTKILHPKEAMLLKLQGHDIEEV
jgi:hypothetical protein